MKYSIITVAFAFVFLACKKTETLKPEVLPDTYVDPTYTGKLESNLSIGVGSNGPVDSVFSFSSGLWEQSGDPAPFVGFGRVIYNGRTSSTVDNGVKFLDFANRSSWDIQSTYIGNFTHIDNTIIPLIGNAAGLIPSSFSGGSLTINLQNVSNADQIVVSLSDLISLGGSTQKFAVQGNQNLSLNFYNGINQIPVDSEVQIKVTLWKFNKLVRNGNNIELNKSTTYIYRTKKTS